MAAALIITLLIVATSMSRNENGIDVTTMGFWVFMLFDVTGDPVASRWTRIFLAVAHAAILGVIVYRKQGGDEIGFILLCDASAVFHYRMIWVAGPRKAKTIPEEATTY